MLDQSRIPLVLIHGWAVNSLIWEPILPALESEFDVTVIDLPGYRSNSEHVGEQTLEPITTEVLAQAPTKAVWVGWSLGATIALSAALSGASTEVSFDRISKLQVISGTPRFMVGDDWEFGTQPEPFAQLADQFKDDFDKALKKFLLLQSNTSDKTRLREVRSNVRATCTRQLEVQPPSINTLMSGLKILDETDLRNRIGEIKLETQVVAGRHDRVVPYQASEHLAKSLPNGHLELMQTGHLPFLDKPEEYLTLLRAFAKRDPQ